MYYPCSENKGADQLRGYREADLRLCFHICRMLVFSWCGSYIINTPTHVNREIASTKHMISLMPPLNLNYPPFLFPTTPYRCSDYCTYSPYLSIVCHVSICNCICKFCSMSIVRPEREIKVFVCLSVCLSVYNLRILKCFRNVFRFECISFPFFKVIF